MRFGPELVTNRWFEGIASLGIHSFLAFETIIERWHQVDLHCFETSSFIIEQASNVAGACFVGMPSCAGTSFKSPSRAAGIIEG